MSSLSLTLSPFNLRNTGVSYLKIVTSKNTCKILRTIGMAEIRAMTKISFVSLVYVAGSGKKIPIENGTRMPKVIQSWDKPPIGPLYSVGAVSAKNLGQKSENKPAEAPKIILPTKKT